MSHFFFKPIVRILHERRELIEGRLGAAQQGVAEADKKTGEYEQALKSARTETFRQQEGQRERALAEKTELLNRAKKDTDRTVQDARTRLLSEADSATRKLDSEVTGLAQALTAALLQDKS